MHLRRSLIAGLSVSALAASLTVTGFASAEPHDPPPVDGGHPAPLAEAADRSRMVTLVTGDRVMVRGDGTVVPHPGEGRGGVAFATQRTAEQVFVIPSDAEALLAAGRLDRRLFDVTLLAEIGERTGRGDLGVIVTHEPATLAAATGDDARDLPAVDGVALRVDQAAATELWDELTGDGAGASTLADSGSTVWLDGLRELALDRSVPRVGAPAAWERGLDGSGVSVAVLDSGVDPSHPDLAGQVAASENFTDEPDGDLNGHGTHVASTVAGTGAGRAAGVAPGARLLSGKACGADGFCAESSILAGMQWAAEHGAAVVNMSLSAPDSPGPDPLEQAVEALTAEYGVLFVAAAGNEGADASVGSPASAGAALAVGAVDRDDTLAYFSSRGPRVDGALKPDLTAPGVDITAAVPGGGYASFDGTSMATPHVAGAAATLAQQHPGWSPERLKAALMAAAAPDPDTGVAGQGAGRLDVARAVSQAVVTSPASVSFDRQPWPHEDDVPQTATVSYRNGGDVAVTLDLALTAAGPAGEPVPAGMFTLEATTVTVPAGGSAEVGITVDTTIGDLDGYLGGHLTATGGGLVVRTPFGVDREVETHRLTLRHLDRDGAPTTDYLTYLSGLDNQVERYVEGESEVTVRVLPGRYFLDSMVSHPRADGTADHTLLVQPWLEVTEDQTVTLDARTGEPVSIKAPDPAAVPVVTIVDALVVADRVPRGLGTSAGVFGPDRLFTAQLGSASELDGLATTVAAELAVPTPDGGVDASTTVYHLAWFVADEFITGFTRAVAARELATVRADYAAQVDGSEAGVAVTAERPDKLGGYTWGRPIDVPLRRTEFYNSDGDVRWRVDFGELLVTGESVADVIFLTDEPIGFRPGRVYRERWNYGVFGPLLTDGFSGVFRTGNELAVVPDLYGDGAGNRGWVPSTGIVRVFRDGELVGGELPLGEAFLEVPPEPAAYRVEVEAEREAAAPLSRRTSLVWEFDSSYLDDETQLRLPVPVVRFSPDLAPDNTAPAGRPFQVPVSVQSAPEAGGMASLTVEVSFDDGQTWREARVSSGEEFVVSHPQGSGFVSLRASVTDTEGNQVDQTIIRAYEFG